MAELDPSIILAAGNINDPGRIAANQQAEMQAQQMRQQIGQQNMLRKVLGSPGAVTPDGMVTPNALQAVMKVDPNTGFALQKSNRDTELAKFTSQFEQLKVKAASNELAAGALDYGASAWADGIKAYDAAKKANRSEADALALATKARNDRLAANGGQISEDAEKAAMSVPFDPDKARIVAGHDKDYSASLAGAQKQANEDRQFALDARKEASGEKHQAWEETHGDRADALAARKEKFDESQPQFVKSGDSVYNPKTGMFSNPADNMVTPHQGGLTPRASFGGDNPDGIVDKKIGFIAAHVGVDPDTPLTPQQLSTFRDAYIKTEGAKGNNVGNLKNASGQGFQQFGSRDQGLNAITAQINRDYGRGQVTIRQLIDGVPKGGADKGVGGMAPEAIDFAARQGLAEGGRVPPGFARNKQAMTAIENRMAEIAKSEGKTPQDYMASGAGFKADAHSLLKLQNQVDAMSAFEKTTLANGKAAMVAAIRAGGPETVRLFRTWNQAGRRQINDPNIRALDVAIRTVASEYGKAIGGGANGNSALTDSARKEAEENLTTADSPAALGAAIDQMKIDMENRRSAYQGQLAEIKGRISGKQSTSPQMTLSDDQKSVLKQYGL